MKREHEGSSARDFFKETSLVSVHECFVTLANHSTTLRSSPLVHFKMI